MLSLVCLWNVGIAFPIMPIIQKWDFSYHLHKPSFNSVSPQREEWLLSAWEKMKFLQMKYPIPEAVELVFNERQLISKKSSVP